MKAILFASILATSFTSTYSFGACSLAKPGDCFGGKFSNDIKPEFREAWSIVSTRYYAETYPDLMAAFGNNDSQLFAHWANSGRYEGRRPSPAFDPAFYLNSNPDLKAAFGEDLSRASYHWYEWGRQECRAGSAEFNPLNYLNRYPDLKAAFGNDCTAAYNHYISAGYYEGRDAR